MSFNADPAERLIASPPDGVSARARRSLAPFALSLLVHVSALAILFFEPSLTAEAQRDEEIPVEVVVEPPPAPPPQETPEPQPEPEKPPPQEKQKPPQQKIVEDEKPAFDAPRAPNEETVEREAPDQETRSERAAPPNDQKAAKPSSEQNPDPERQVATQAEAQAAPPKSEDEKADAEIIELAERKPEAPLDEKQGQVEVKASPEPKRTKSIADQIASLAPVPDFKIAGSSKPAPVSGGTAKTSYLSVLFGMIMRHMHIPPHVRGKATPYQGVVAFYVDATGNLTHQAVYQSSGFPALDAAALAAVRRAAPFPPPPSGHSQGIQFHYTPR